MKILFTGASSFSGFWFAKELAQNGHEVVCIMRQSLDAYQGTRQLRIKQLSSIATLVFDCPYGSEHFFRLIENASWDVFCHHAADVSDYKSLQFNVAKAVTNNVGDIMSLLRALLKSGCDKVVLTGSVFEQNEGAGSDGLKAVSPYGLSKGVTAEIFKFYTQLLGMRLGKFVIPNPFGPYEEFRFTSFLVHNWLQQKQAPVSHPAYVRDNIHVSLLAKAYVHFVESLNLQNVPLLKLNPSGYPESQGAFTARFSEEMRLRLGVPCEYKLEHQKEFPEPKVRINTDPLDSDLLDWNEKNAWDSLAHYYLSTIAKIS